MTNLTHSTRLALASVALISASACGGQPSDPMTDAGPLSDAAAPPDAAADSGVAFDPNMTYPGEGEPCEFSLFCSELQICVDGECARHERFEEGDLVLGTPTRIPHELLRTSTLYTEATLDWDASPSGGALYGGILPGRSGPILAFFRYQDRECQAALYGEGPPRMVYVPGLRCATVGINPEGYVMLGGTGVAPDYQKKWALIGPDDELVAEGGYPASFQSLVHEATDDPEITLFSITSIVWHEGRFLFSVSAGKVTGDPRDYLIIGGPKYPSHSFFAELDLNGAVELASADGSSVHEGSFGWLVRDEGGVRSILTVFDDPASPTDMRIDVLSWGTGERATVARGVAGPLAGTSRYFQPDARHWALSTFHLNSYCSRELFLGTERVGVMWSGPEDDCYEPPVIRLAHENHLGSSAPYGPVYTGNSALEWLAYDYLGDEAAPTFYTTEGRELLNLTESDPPIRALESMQAISRFGRTVEIFASASNEGAEETLLSYWELPLSRSEP